MEQTRALEFVTLGEVARRTKIGTRQLRRAIAKGDLPVFDVGAWPRVRWDHVLAWLEGQRRNAPLGSRAADATEEIYRAR